MTLEEAAITRIFLQIEDLRHLVYIITEVLSATILLLFILVLVLGWRVNKDRRRLQAEHSVQTFVNQAYQLDEETDNKTRNMQYMYTQESPQEGKIDYNSNSTQNIILFPSKT